MKDFAQIIAEFQQAVLDKTPETGDKLATPREGFSGAAQMQAYITDYRLRLIAVTEADYPATLHYLGKTHLVADYVESTPSRSPNINRYPWGFAGFLKNKADGFSCDLAALEHAISFVYQAEDSPALTLASLQAQAPDAMLTQALQPRLARHMLALEHDAETYLQAFRVGEPPLALHFLCHLVIIRHQNQVQRFRLEPLAFRLLSLLDGAHTLPDALDQLETDASEDEQLGAVLQHWLLEWISHGFFRIPS